MMILRWLGATRATYIGNATAIRDYRTQLRGNKAFWLWGIYLALLIGICGFAYNQFADQGSQSISVLQARLTSFYHTVIGILAGMIVLVGPGLTASAITMERQRRSLDLIFSAPVKPRYLLVGKMIAGLRYLLMLLILALPVVSVCVVMGGATWSDVIGAFINLLNCGIVMLAIGLLMSSIVGTNIGAILGAYSVIAMYCVISGMLTFETFSALGGTPGASNGNLSAPWYGNLFPFTASFTAPTFTLIGDTEVPNWAFGTVYSLLISKVLLSGAGSALSPYDSGETKGLRVHGLIIVAAMMFLLAGPLAVRGAMAAATRVPSQVIGMFLGCLTIATFFLWPNIMCYGNDSERRFWHDGVFSPRKMFKASPSGALPYLGTLIVVGAVALYLGVSYFSSGLAPAASGRALAMKDVQVGIGVALIWCLGFVTFWWGVARYVSAVAGNLRGARLGLISGIIVLLALPAPVFSVIQSANLGHSSQSDPIWRLHLLFPLFASEGASQLGIYGAICAVLGVILAYISERSISQRKR